MRVKLYKEMYSDILLLVEPVLTRCGTWIHGALFYRKSRNAVRNVIKAFDSSDSSVIST